LNKLKVIILITLFLLFSGLFCFILNLFMYADMPASSIDHNEKIILIKPGQNFKSFSERLQKADIIKDLYKFNLLARIKGYDKKIKAGEYLLSAAMPPNKIFHIVVSGKVRLYKLTIPEGYNLNQIARLTVRFKTLVVTLPMKNSFTAERPRLPKTIVP